MPTIDPCVILPLTGASVGMPFPTIPKPVPGGWTVSVTLKSDSTLRGSSKATITVLQNGKTLATLSITPSTSFVTYDIPISDSDLDKGTDGVCQVAGVVVIVSEDGLIACCPGQNLPKTLYVDLVCDGCGASPEGCPCWSDFTATIKSTDNPSVWAGNVEIPGCDSSYQMTLTCDNFGGWTFVVHDCQTTWGQPTPIPPSCDPFELHFLIGISTACCINPSGSSYEVSAVIRT